jgi:hypothetical protein
MTPPEISTTDPLSILADAGRLVGGMSDQWGWADDEIEQACCRHPLRADDLYHSFGLLRPTHDGMGTESAYRSHCRELLARVAKGGDTREATDVEVALACHDISLVTPINSSATVVYMRAFRRAFPTYPGFENLDLRSYEHVSGFFADELESLTYRKLRRPERVLPTRGECPGRHRGEPRSECPYAA